MGYLLWNDEIPPTRENPRPANNHLRGHSKGILAYCRSTNTGLYLLHSTPRFPLPGHAEFPDAELIYGQTFLCISLTYQTAHQIAEVICTHHEPQIYSWKVGSEGANSSFAKLIAHEIDAKDSGASLFVDFQFRSKDRNQFRLFAKNRRWSEPAGATRAGRDFWNHLVGPALRDSMDVESWRRGEVFENVIPGTDRVTLDVFRDESCRDRLPRLPVAVHQRPCEMGKYSASTCRPLFSTSWLCGDRGYQSR